MVLFLEFHTKILAKIRSQANKWREKQTKILKIENKRNRIEMRQDFYLAFYRLIEHELIMHIISQSVSDVQRMQF